MLVNARGAGSTAVIILRFTLAHMGFVIANTPQDLRIVRHQPWRRPLAIGASAVIALITLMIGYRLGIDGAVSEKVDQTTLLGRLQAAEAELAEVKAELVDSRLSADVAREAITQLREEMRGKHEETERLQEQVTFYKSLMAPGELQEGLKINELELSRTGDGQAYRFELLLTQVAVRRSFISGDVRLDFIGMSQEGQVVKSLTELAPQSGYPLKFRFRYFQDLVGEFELRDDFQPERIMVTASQRGKEPLQVSFPWPSWATSDLAAAQ